MKGAAEDGLFADRSSVAEERTGVKPYSMSKSEVILRFFDKYI
jgi:hypothetical protein